MRFLIIFFSLFLMSCSANFGSVAPRDLQQVYEDVNNIMVYDESAPKWTINPIKKDILGQEYRLGSCSNYVLLYMEKLKGLGYNANQLRPIYSHVYLQVTMEDGSIYNLDSAKVHITKIKDKEK